MVMAGDTRTHRLPFDKCLSSSSGYGGGTQYPATGLARQEHYCSGGPGDENYPQSRRKQSALADSPLIAPDNFARGYAYKR
jgi:hypothetical protein